jgi:hypothetical protein
MEDLINDLSMFTGTENYYLHNIGNFQYTDGIKYLAEKANCYWLLDIIGSYQQDKKVINISFQIWELNVSKINSAQITMKEDDGMPIIIKQKIPYTDFPLREIKLYYIDNILILPSEY